ncbi:MAG: RNA polymerase factor sigma-54 [Flavobacteriales bacterium]
MQKQRLKQELGQKLSPQQIQFLGLLQIPLTALENRIEEELENNPALEDAEPEKEPANEEDYWGKNSQTKSNHLESSNDVIKERELSLQEFLLQQLPMLGLDSNQYSIAEFIIGCLDDNGFLSRSLLSITDDLLFKMNIDINENQLFPILDELQKLDPVGVAARDLKECLLIQLNQKTKSPATDLAKNILANEYTAFSNRNYEKLIRVFEVSSEELKLAYKKIEQLNPKPGASFSHYDEGQTFITPDFKLEIENDDIKVSLNNSKVRRLKSSQYYKHMLVELEKGKGDKEAIRFLKDKIEGANWFVNALIQREQTLLNTLNCIVEIQSDFFKSGNEQLLKPMKLVDIAEKIELDISTISRVTNSKYVETPYGTFLLKEFFSDAFSKKDGTTISNKVLKSHLKDIIEQENKKKPYSDELLSEKFDEIGFHIARRTVAKYREQLGIPTARLRREL